MQKSGNTMDAVRDKIDEITPNMEKILTVAFDTVNHNTLYTPKAFAKGSSARKTLEYSLSDLASADRAVVKERLAEGWSLEEAAAEFLSDAYFEEWYLKTLAQLDEYAG